MNSSEKKSINKLLTIGFILSFFFCISGLVVSIIGIVKAKKNNYFGCSGYYSFGGKVNIYSVYCITYC